ncbi:MAG TPA: S8 family serine peptidase [Opitutaceae bacterium]|nr:S8 family serine peptidase [Opitutaceae bacterium]
MALLAFAPLVAVLPARADAPTAKIAVHTADDLPRHTYAMTEAPSRLVEDDAAFAAFATAVKKDIEADLAAYDIQDRTSLQRYKGTLLALALLDRDDDAARRLIAELRALEEKPSLKLTTGLVSEAWLDARRKKPAPDAFAAALQARLTGLLAPMPWDLVQNDIKQLKAGFEVRSAALLIGSVQEEIDPAALKTGKVSGDVAATLIGIRNQLVNYLPYKTAIVAALDADVTAHRVVKPDRWTPTLVTLPTDAKASPVLIGIWDSGVDIALFPGRIYTDPAGKHGFAFDLHDNVVPDLLYPLDAAEQKRLPEIVTRLKGFLDLQAAVDSPEASELKKYMSELKPDQVKPTLEDLGLIGDRSHGTHVAGIAVAGNPFARIVVGRITFDYHLIPEKPTIEQAKKDAASYLAAADYFKRAGVRVVNMSWGGSLKDVEDALEANGAGGTAEERKKLARQIFDIGRDGLLAALKSAPDILFVAAAGNSDNNVKFDEFIPSSFQLPNMITVGAVDQAGEETSFSSFGPMVNVHANGFEVSSYIPGGQLLKFSGTSMAAPQVTNLAAKLFALDPALTPAAAKELILAGCVKNGRVNLVNEANSVALLQKKLATKK